MTFFYLAGAVGLTLAVKVYLFVHYYTINNDGILYIEAGRHFWMGSWREGLASFYPPLFPLMIAGVYPLVGDWELAGQFWPFVLGLLTLIPLYRLLQSFYGGRVACLALFFYAVNPYLARLSLHVRSEIPYAFFLISAVYFLHKAMDQGNKLFFCCGVSAGLAYLIRAEGLGLMVVGTLFILYRGWSRRNLRSIPLQLACIVVGFGLVAAPYVLYLKWDTGSWLISRKAGLILSMGLTEHDLSTERTTMKDSDQVSVVRMILSRPGAYARKVSVDLFRSFGVYLEALHYSFLPFLFVGWFFFFRGRFWRKGDMVLAVTVAFYLLAFSMLYVNRRYAVTLVPFSLGWVAVGYLTIRHYVQTGLGSAGRVLAGLIPIIVFVTTLPKTLQAVGQEKVYLREAGLYLNGRAENATLLTTNGRVAFYATGQNAIVVGEADEISNALGSQQVDYLALDDHAISKVEPFLNPSEWTVERKFSSDQGETLVIYSRRAS